MKISTDFIGSWVHGLASAFDVFTSCYYFGLLLVSVWDLLTSNIWWVFLWALLKIWKIWQITMHLTTFCHFSGSTASFRACPLPTFPPFLYLSYSEHSLTSLRSNFLKQIVCANYKSIFPILLHDLRLLFSIPTKTLSLAPSFDVLYSKKICCIFLYISINTNNHIAIYF